MRKFWWFLYTAVFLLKSLIWLHSGFFSEAEPKGSDCFEKFSEMNECMSNYPELYENNDEQMSEAAEESAKTTEKEQKEAKSWFFSGYLLMSDYIRWRGHIVKNLSQPKYSQF